MILLESREMDIIPSAYNVYNILLILSSYSMPVAISKMISSRLARGEYENCRRILRAGLCMPPLRAELQAVHCGLEQIYLQG